MGATAQALQEALRGGPKVGLRMKSMFFDRDVVKRSLDRASRRVLSKFGAYVRTAAKSSIKAARQKKLAEMSQEERRRYRMLQSIAKRKGLKPPKKPLASSRPGQPPRNRTGLLKRMIYFVFEPSRRSVIIGPEAFRPNRADVLEYGGTTVITAGANRGRPKFVAARPYMGPALEQEQPKLPAMWRDAMKP